MSARWAPLRFTGPFDSVRPPDARYPCLDVSVSLKPLVLTLDLLGTFVFTLSGAVTGMWRRLELFGVLLLSFVAANQAL